MFCSHCGTKAISHPSPNVEQEVDSSVHQSIGNVAEGDTVTGTVIGSEGSVQISGKQQKINI